MQQFISTILNMSLTGSIVILVVLAARLMMRKLPKKYLYLLWAVVGFRLLCPVTLESSLSIFNIKPLKDSMDTVKDLPVVNLADRDLSAGRIISSPVKTAEASAFSVDPAHIVLLLWAAVAITIVIYIIRQYFLLRKDLKDVTELAPGLCVGKQIDSPFVMGLLKPVIYMPDGLADDEMKYLLLHEKTHIRRRDTIFKAIGLFTVALHWFNPLVWIAYKLFVQDMEMSCDEEVISELGANVKADYSMSLVSFASRNHQPKYIVVPVTFSKNVFGRKEVKMRIKNILSYNGTSKLIATLSLVLVAAIGLVCMFNATTHADAQADGQLATAPTTVEEDNDDALQITATEAPAEDKNADDANVPYEGTEPAADADANANVPFEAKDAEEGSAVRKYLAEQPTESGKKIDQDDIDAVDKYIAEQEADQTSGDKLAMITPGCFGIELPIVDSEHIFNKVDLGKGKHTTKESPELGFSMGPNEVFKGRVFEIRSDKKVADNLFNAQVETLENMGFEKFLDEVSGTYYGYNKDLKIAVVIENCTGIYRTSYFDMASTNEVTPFMCLG